MASSWAYWRFAENVKDELVAIAEDAKDMYGRLEGNDDPGDLATDLVDLSKRIDKLNEQIGLAVSPLKKVAAAFAAVPEYKG